MAKSVLSVKEKFALVKWLTLEKREAFQKAGCTWQHVAQKIKEELGFEINHKDVLLRILEAADIEPFFPAPQKPMSLSDILDQRFAALERRLERAETLLTNVYNQVEAPIPE